MPRKLPPSRVLSHLQQVALMIALDNDKHECSYKTLRAMGYSKTAISRSARRLEKRGLATRATHHLSITYLGSNLMFARATRPTLKWVDLLLRVLELRAGQGANGSDAVHMRTPRPGGRVG